MTWREEWQRLSAEIAGLIETARLFWASQVRGEGDTTPLTGVLLPHSTRVFDRLEEFHQRYSNALPPAGADALSLFVEKNKALFTSTEMKGRPQMRLTLLASVRAELDYLLADSQTHLRTISERAFIHLQRSIVADETFRARWKATFQQGEVACERLGAVHLLQHGIWCFKAYAKGEQTDLVFQEPVVLADVARTAEGLVLTEWKVVRDWGKLAGKLAEAKAEADRYGTGSLSGFELAGYRYLVMVTEKHAAMPPDDQQGDVTYRHINIAVDPNPPSSDARERPA